MNHLILGFGNMGRRHAKILESFGDICDYADLGFNPDMFDFSKINSILICTPPETHLSYIEKLTPLAIPIFIEKPVIVESCKTPINPNSMVACNWRFCTHIPDGNVTIYCKYKSLDRHRLFDFIHFVDAFWDRHGRPAVSFSGSQDTYRLILWRENIKWECTICFSGQTETIINSTAHEKCEMFHTQMNLWRACVQRRGTDADIGFINPINMARERTLWLLNLLESVSQPKQAV